MGDAWDVTVQWMNKSVFVKMDSRGRRPEWKANWKLWGTMTRV